MPLHMQQGLLCKGPICHFFGHAAAGSVTGFSAAARLANVNWRSLIVHACTVSYLCLSGRRLSGILIPTRLVQ